MSDNIVTLTYPTSTNVSEDERKQILEAFQGFIADLDDDAKPGAAILTVMNKQQIKDKRESDLIDVLNSSDFTATLSIKSHGMPDAYMVELVNEADDEEDN